MGARIGLAVAGMLLVAFVSPARSADLDVTLTVKEPAGLARVNEPVSAGVPLPVGAVKDPATLKLVDEQGNEMPAQFSAINRWGADQSIMWLLVQSEASVPANGTASYRLTQKVTGRSIGNMARAVKVTDGADAITVETGKIKFTVNKKRFNLIDGAWLTADGKETQVIQPGHDGGSRMTLAADGGVYASTVESPTEVTIEESGPMRATIVVRGMHRPVGGQGKLPYLYGYLVRIRAYAGQPYVRVSYALTSGHLPATGSPVVKDAAIAVPAGITGQETGKGDGWVSGGGASLAVRYLKENAPATLAVSAPEGRGGAAFVLSPFGDGEDFLDICSYKTYEMQLTLAPAGAAAKGDDLLKSFDQALRFWCGPQWVNQTKAWSDFGYVSVPDEKLQAAMLRRFRPYSLTGWRDHGSTGEFESGSSRAPGGGYEPLLKTAGIYLGYLQTNDRRLFDQGERTAWHWRDRRYIYLDGEWAGKKWEGGAGVYRLYYNEGQKNFPDVQPANYARYGGAWNYGGRYGPMDTQHFSVDEVVNYFYWTGDRQCLEALRMYGNQAAGFVGAFAAEAAKGSAKVGRAHGWVARALVNVYEATGEEKHLALSRTAVKAICEAQDKTAGTISPIAAIEMGAYTRKMGPANHVPFMNAAVGMALGRYYRHYPEQEDVRDAILGIADWLAYDVVVDPPEDIKAKNPRAQAGFSYYWTSDEWQGYSASGHRCMSTMGWAYLATGQQRYLDAADKHAGKIEPWYENGFGQEYVYIKTTPRADAIPPAAVKDLAGEALGGGKVRLTWTAPGNDGAVGQAAEYQVKHATMEIKERSDWRNKADSEVSFWAATNVRGEPQPSPAGTKETFTIEGLAPGVYWFAMKSYDSQPNQSDLSNVVKVEVK